MSEISPIASIDQLRAVMEDGIAAGAFHAIDAPLEHYQVGDLYGRRIYVPAGTTIVTKVHKTRHITIALKGHCTVINERGESSDVIAPHVMITEPGTLRAIYAHTEVEWFTAHMCPETDPEAREQFLACDTMAEYNALQLENKS